MIAVYALGVFIIAAMCWWELHRHETAEWVKRQRRRVRRAWHDLFEYDPQPQQHSQPMTPYVPDPTSEPGDED